MTLETVNCAALLASVTVPMAVVPSRNVIVPVAVVPADGLTLTESVTGCP